MFYTVIKRINQRIMWCKRSLRRSPASVLVGLEMRLAFRYLAIVDRSRPECLHHTAEHAYGCGVWADVIGEAVGRRMFFICSFIASESPCRFLPGLLLSPDVVTARAQGRGGR